MDVPCALYPLKRELDKRDGIEGRVTVHVFWDEYMNIYCYDLNAVFPYLTNEQKNHLSVKL